jgi:Phosphate-selective porin
VNRRLDDRTAGQQTFFSYRTGDTATFADGKRLRISPQAYYYYGLFGLLTEYVTVSQNIRRNIGALTRQGTVDSGAWQVAVSYLLTGEAASYKNVKPKHPFTLSGEGWGAFEVAARYNELNVDEEAFRDNANSFADPTRAAEEARAWALGLNWYLSNSVRLEVNYEKTAFDGGGGGTTAAPLDRSDEKVFLSRIQLAF